MKKERQKIMLTTAAINSYDALPFPNTLKKTKYQYKGFGKISKYAMSDIVLTPDSKAIYAYLCSYTGAKAIAYPSVYKITKDLKISEKRYRDHFKFLVEQGYIEVTQEKNKDGKYNRNIYTIAAKPKKYQENPETEEEKEIYDKINMYGIQKIGYGTITQDVMFDDRLSITAKTIYSYLCSYAGNTDNAFPTRATILFHLKLCKSTYYKHYNQLVDLGYIQPYIVYDAEKKCNCTTYVINDGWEFRKKVADQSTEFVSTANVRAEFVGAVNMGANINVPNSTSTNINNKNHQSASAKKVRQSKQQENIGLMDFPNKNNEDKKEFVTKELLINNGIPQHYSENKNLLKIAVDILSENQMTTDNERLHKIILECVSEMAYNSHNSLKYKDIIPTLNEFIIPKTNSVSFTWLSDFEYSFENSLKTYGANIQNIKGYIKTSIFNFLSTYDIQNQYSTRLESSSFGLEEFFNRAIEIGMRTGK